MTKRAVLLFMVLASCEDDALTRQGGVLEVEVRNARSEARTILVKATPDSVDQPFEQQVDAIRPSTFVAFNDLTPGVTSVSVTALDRLAIGLDVVTVQGIVIVPDRVARVVIDFALIDPTNPTPPPEEICNGIDDDNDGVIDDGVSVLCGECQADGSVTKADDDPLCGEIPCDALNSFTLSGDNTATGRSECRSDRFGPLTDNRCLDVGQCRMPHDETVCGPPVNALALEAVLCQTISGCAGQQAPMLVISADGTPCGPMDICMGGVCVADQPMPMPDPIGCSDGEREGFEDQARFPDIAACSGGWSVPGTRTTLAPACNRNSGDDSQNTSGNNCNVADLCASGWHMCLDKEEVAIKSPSGCTGSVPAGTASNELLFITRQRSTNNIVCEDRATATGVNDLVGCGNLGAELDASKGCDPLNRALASQHDGSCDFNEAEPPLGPWVCGADSVAESENVIKQGSGKGGVLCCKN